LDDKNALEPRTTSELLNCPKVEEVAFDTLFLKPDKNPVFVFIAIYYYKYF